jgi:DNA-binding NtrC family response regulator
MTHGHILLVDDDPGFLTALTKTLAKQNYEVTGAASAANALEKIQNRKHEFDLVITDLSMPLIGGLAVLSAVKTAFPSVPVIVITAFGDQLTQANALRNGACAFVQKPLDPEEFLAVVARAMKAETQPAKPKQGK